MKGARPVRGGAWGNVLTGTWATRPAPTLLKLHTVYIGSVNTAQIRIGEVFKEAVRLNSTALLVAHNHPSSEPAPSPDDVAVTRAIVQAGNLLDIAVLDHLVICQGRWVSLKERGLGFDV